MIKFKFTSSKRADSDGEFWLLFEVLEQDESQIAKGLSIYSFQASNGWAVKSCRGVNIITDEKTVEIIGESGSQSVLWLIETNTHKIWFKTESEMFSVMKDVSEALAEWAKAGGFSQVSDFDVKEFSL